MWGRQFGMAVALAIVAASGVSQAERSFCKMVSTDSRVLYLWAEYKMLRGDHQSAVDLLQMAAARKKQEVGQKVESSQHSRGSGTCTEYRSQPIPMVF